MKETLSIWMKLAATAVIIAALVWGVLMNEVSSIVHAIGAFMGGDKTP